MFSVPVKDLYLVNLLVISVILHSNNIVYATVLPEDRADGLYHYYDGGGVTVDGPAILVRKEVLEDMIAVNGSYYIDNISSASPDVVSYASPYTDQRTEYGLGVDYLYRDTQLSINYSNSEESDYLANTYTFSASHEMLSAMTTISFSYTRGYDEIGKTTDLTFQEEANNIKFRFGISQVLTKTMLLNIDLESTSSDGFLNNPYRSVRILGSFGTPERYPEARSGTAIAIRGLMYLKERRSIRLGYRFYADNWDIAAHTFEAGYNFYYAPKWLSEFNLRFYAQSKASFYRNNFDSLQNYMARDKELSTFFSLSFGYRATYNLFKTSNAIFKQGDLNFAYNYIYFNYRDYYDYSNNPAVGTLYSFNANVLQIYFTSRY